MNVWDVKLTVSEEDGHALAAATLYGDGEIIRGSGQAFGMTTDAGQAVPSTAVRLAVARSLLDLVAVLLQSTEAGSPGGAVNGFAAPDGLVRR